MNLYQAVSTHVLFSAVNLDLLAHKTPSNRKLHLEARLGILENKSLFLCFKKFETKILGVGNVGIYLCAKSQCKICSLSILKRMSQNSLNMDVSTLI